MIQGKTDLIRVEENSAPYFPEGNQALGLQASEPSKARPGLFVE